MLLIHFVVQHLCFVVISISFCVETAFPDPGITTIKIDTPFIILFVDSHGYLINAVVSDFQQIY